MSTHKIKALSAAVALTISTSIAFADGRLEGRVVAADNTTYLEGATVRIESLDRGTVTSRDGRFLFSGLPAGDYTLEIRYLGAPPMAEKVNVTDRDTTGVEIVLGQSMDEIVVRGARGGNASALNQQRASDTIVSVVSADSIGALPDSNVAEAVQRVPGVFLERDQGEGRYIGIRGIDPNLNTTTINGTLIPSPDAGARSVALDVIPSDLLEGLEIRKTFTPDMDASAIGGTVNVRSLSAFDRDGRTMTVTAEGSYNSLVEEYSPKVAGSFTDVFDLGGGIDNFGVAIAASWFDRDFGSDNLETGGWPNDLETVDGSIFKGLEELEQRAYTINRERTGIAVNFDLRNTRGSYYLRNLYSEFSDQEYRVGNTWVFDDGDAIEGTDTSALWDGSVVEKELKDRLETQQILSVVVGGENYLNSWTVDYSYAHSASEEREPDALYSIFEAEDLTIGYNSIGRTLDLVFDPALADADNFALTEFELVDGVGKDESDTVKLNLTRDLFNSRYNGNVKFGVLHRKRAKDYRSNVGIYEDPFGQTLTPFAVDNPRYGLGEFGPGIDADAMRDYFYANQSNLDYNVEDSAIESTIGDYDMNEDVTAAYLMSTFERGGMRVSYGLRYEDTSFDASGTRFVANDVTGSGDPQPVPVSYTNDYDNVLPSINVRFETGDLVWRAAITQTIARPNFEELSPGGEIEFEVDDTENVLEAEIGNPSLDPVEATNVDFGVEWYPGGVSAITAGIFYKRLENFVVYADVGDSIDLSQFVGSTPVNDAQVIQPINGDSADLFGLEVGYLQQFDSGLYLAANGTFIDSEARYPQRDDSTQLPRTPETVLNGAVGWENEILSLRLAATYRDQALQEFGELDDPEFDIYQDDHLQFDLSAKWNITEQLQLALSAVNLTDEPYYRYFATPRYNAQYEEYGRTYSLALRFTPF